MIRAPLCVVVVSALVSAVAVLSSCAGGEPGNALGITLTVEEEAKPLARCARVYVRPDNGPELLTEPLAVEGKDELSVAVFRGELTESVTVGAHGYAATDCTGAAIVYAEEQTVRFQPEKVENLSLRIRGRRIAEPLPASDADGDGHAAPDAGKDCDDANASVHPGAAEVCDNDIDDDCSGKKDCEDTACSAAPNCQAEPPQCEPRVCHTSALSEARACVYKPRPDFSACANGVCRNGECTQAFPYTPSNFTVPAAGDFTRNVVLDCNARMTFNSTTRTFTNWCPGAQQPIARVIQQPGGGGDAVLLTMRGLTVTGAQTRLRFTGDLPVIVAVLGDANIAGALDAGSQQLAGNILEKGAGASPAACTSERGQGAAGAVDGGGGQRRDAGGGGGGGAFGGPGAAGGNGGDSSGGTAGAAAPQNDALSPLRGGCNGGAGGAVPAIAGGLGGGALQISVAGTLKISGEISASGQGGRTGGSLDGGGGGGSGGALLLEASQIEAAATAAITANGGGGGGGAGVLVNGVLPQPGREGLERDVAPAPGGTGGGIGGGAGGAGGSAQAEPANGVNGREDDPEGGGGGGGGGTGRVRIHARGGTCRLETTVLSPAPIRAGSCVVP